MDKELDIWSMVNRRATDEVAKCQEQFVNANPFPHVIIDDFFTPEFVAELERDFPRKSEAYDRFCVEDGGKIGTNYSNGKVEEFPPAFARLDALVRHKDFRKHITAATGIGGLEYDAEYFGGGIRESRSRTFLPPHLDFNHHPKTHSHRRMNLLFYLNPEWKEEWGGNLQVHRDPNVYNRNDSLVHSYMPVNNRCLIFETSEVSWHGFDRLNLPEGMSRRAFTIYYYTKTRPNADKIKFHNTEYAEPPLPQHFEPGYVLNEDDVALLQEYIGRRDDRIRMLYDLRAEMDVKMRHVWSEYEYYLNLSRNQSKLNSLAGRALNRIKRSLPGRSSS